MPKILFTLLSFFLLCGVYSQNNIIAKNPVVVTGKLIKITRPLREFKPGERTIPNVIVRDLDGIIGKDEAFEEGEDQPRYPSSNIFSTDPALQKAYPNNSHLQNAASRAIGVNFNGMPYQPLNPPDPSMCAGPNHIIQMINGASGALFKVYNKAGGQVVAQTYLDQITLKGGLGDPICLYDQLADRFILTEFANKPETGTEGLIFAVSQTPDPAAGWFVYFFSTDNTFPDYPKFSVWTDAYYATTNDFANGSTYAGSTVYAFDKAKMTAGNTTATMQKFTLGTSSKHFSMSPVCLEGNTLAPAGSGGLIAYMQDDTWTSSTTDIDSIGMFEFKVDFANSANTSITAKASFNTIAYKSDICTTTRGQCITQPGTSVKVEALHKKIMNQPVYRNFGGYEGIVLSHVVDKGSNISGIRWYELRKTTGNWSIYQQSTYAPDNTNRWMPGICYDKYGNIGLAYNVSSSATGVYPGARYTGRKECDALNSMTYSEDVIIAGTASNSSTRYGDYNHLVCDPDGVTFWFTCEYNGASTWSTRIASFTLDPCTASLCGDPSALGSSAITNTSATVSWVAVTNAISYDVDYKISGNSIWTNAVTATTSTSVGLSGLIQGTVYDWRVVARCAAGLGNYVAAQFTTTAPCLSPTTLPTTAITSSSATVNWSAVSGAINYDVQYKANASSTWLDAALATTTTSMNLTNLNPSTLYDWQVRSHCSDSSTTTYSSAQFKPSAIAPVTYLAYKATITTGTQNFGGELGMEFKVNNANGIIVDQLGAFDHQGNGITGTQSGGIRVAIFNKTTKTIVPGLDGIIIGTADSYTGNHRMQNIAPVTLMPGDYAVVAKGYNASELNGNSEGGTPFATGDLGGGAISYASTCWYGSEAPGFSYPNNPDGGPGNRYLAGTFRYSIPSSAPVTYLAYKATITTGTQNFGGELGMEFKVNNANGIIVDQLGAFDHQGNGITGIQSGGIRVAIFNKTTKTIVPGLDGIIIGTADSYTGNHRMQNIAPVTLMPGDYAVVAKGYNASELNGNSEGGTPFAPGDLGGGAISYASTCWYGSEAPGFSYPNNPDGGPGNRYLAGTFRYSIPSSAPVTYLAYKATITTGTQNFGGELGMEFKVNNANGIIVDQLGAFDHQGNGITGTQSGGIRVAIFNKTTKTIVPGLDGIIIGTADGYNGNHRMKNVAPVKLMPGDYSVVAKGYNASELNGNSEGGTPFAPGDLGGGAISYASTCWYGSEAPGFSYPNNPDGGPGNRYLAGTFRYSIPGSSATSSNRIATIFTQTVSTQQLLNVSIAKPIGFSLTNFPNPFSRTTKIKFEIPLRGRVSVKIYNSFGKAVAILFEGEKHAGTYTIDFNASAFYPGIYYCKLTSTNISKAVIQKLVLVK